MVPTQRKKLARTNYHVAWICPVADLELLPAVLLLDEEHERPEIDNHTDENIYEFGSAAGHNIVLATCRQGMTGNVNVSSITAPLFKTFPNIRMALLVGIGGGVPQPDSFSDPLNDLRLGDVVVGWPTSADGRGSVVYYEYGRSRVDGFEMTGTMDKPHTVILNALPSLKLDHDLGRSSFHQHMAKLQSHERLGGRFKHPGLEHDQLFQACYKHVGSYTSNCRDCDSDKLVERISRKDSHKDLFIYHQGRIATGNSVIMDGQKRDSISSQCGGALCIEMEAAGVEVNSRCLVIRGISDYADSHKSDLWRSYAAGKAVVFARELLGKIPARVVKDNMAPGQLALFHPEPILIEVEDTSRLSDTPPQALLEGQVSDETAWIHRNEEYHVPGNKHWLVNRSTNPYFTGRRGIIDTAIKRLTSEDASNEQRRFVLTGMGGQGKSEISLNVANEVRDRFWGIFWVDVSTRNTAEENFTEVAEALGCEKGIDAVRKTLSNLPITRQWLLILDNADNLHTDYQNYIPSGSRGAVLITSRNPQCGQLATAGGHEELDSLGEFECVQLLRKSARVREIEINTKQYTSAVSLVKHLGHHTLAILHAGSYIATAHCSMTEYLEFLRTNRRRLLETSRGQGQSRYDTVYATFGASMEFLELPERGVSEETRKDSLQLLRALSTFHYMSVPLDVFVQACIGVKKALATDKQQEMYSGKLTAWHVAQVPDLFRSEKDDVKFRITQAVTRLESLALVRTEKSGGHAWKSVSMHPLVHGWAGDRQSQQERKEILRMTECIVALSISGFNRWRSYYTQLTLHLKLLIQSDVDLMEDAVQHRCVLQACVHIAGLYHRTVLHRDMYEFTSRMFHRLGLHEQEPTKELRELYNVFAVAADREGSHPAQALWAYEAIARLDEKTLGENEGKRLQNLRNLGSAYRENGQTGKAVTLLRKVVTAHQELGEEHHERLHAQHGLARALNEDDQIKEAIELLDNVVRIRQRLLTEGDPNRLASQHELAVAYLRDGKVAEAILQLEEVARVSTKTFGEDQLETSGAQHWLATAYEHAGRLSEATALYERVVHSRIISLGENHPFTTSAQHWLAAAYEQAGRLPEAVALFERVVNTKTLVLGENHPDLLISQHSLASAYLKAGRVQEAINILELVVEIRNSTLEDTNRLRLVSQHQLGRAYRKDGRISKAINILEQVVDIKNSTRDHTDRGRLASQHELGRAYLEDGRAVEAIELLQHVVEVDGLLYEQGHPTRVLSQELLAEAYVMRNSSVPTSATLSASENTRPDATLQSVEALTLDETGTEHSIDIEGNGFEKIIDKREHMV